VGLVALDLYREEMRQDGVAKGARVEPARLDARLAPGVELLAVERRVEQIPEAAAACPKGELGLVFPNGRGNVESHANIVQRGIGQGLHRFRHFFASWLIDQGFGPKRVQALMGHSSIQITFDTYGHLFPQEDDHDRFAAGELALVAT
jgi:integrase